MNSRLKLLSTAVLCSALVTQLTACGTIFYPERRGQISGQIDPGVAILNGIGLLFYIIPGLIAFGVDFATGAIYLPNGNPTRNDDGSDHEKFTYKLGWMDRLVTRAKDLLLNDEAFVLAGDYNICPTDADVYDPVRFADDALCRPESRARFRTLLNLGLTEAFTAMNPGVHQYSYWDYTGGAWQKDNGLRIDHLLLSPQAADRLTACGIDKTPRGKEKPSDHTPVWIELAD